MSTGESRHRNSGELQSNMVSPVANDQSFLSMIETAPNPIMIVREGNYVYANPAGNRLLGFASTNELLGKSIAETVHPDCGESILRSLTQSENPDSSHPVTLRFVRPDGEERVTETTAIRIPFAGEASTLMISHDITDRDQADSELKRSRAELESIYDNAPVMMCVMKPNREVLYANKAFTRLTGITQDELRGGRACGVFGCINALDDVQGCGFGPKCVDCNLRLALEDTRTTGQSHHDIEYNTTLVRENNRRDIALVGSTALIQIEDQRNLLLCLQDITDRVQAERALRESEERFQSLFERAPLGYQSLDANARFIEVNRTWLEMLGYRKDEVIGRWFGDFIAPEELDAFRSRFPQFLAAGKVSSEINLMHKNGGQRLIAIEGRVSHHPDGGCTQTHCILQEITELKKAEEALADSEANFRTFFSTIGDFVIVASPEGRILHVNESLKKRLGYTLEEFRRMDVLALHPPDRHREAADIFAALIRGDREDCPLPFISKAGEEIPVETHVWFGHWNKANCLFAIATDLTEEQESRQRFEALFHANPALMALSSMSDKRFFDVNEAFLKTLGFSRAEVIGKTSAELNLFPDVQKQAAMGKELAERGTATDFELRVRRKDGTILHGLFSGEIVSSQKKKYYLTVMLDITERKQAEETLRQVNQQLNAETQLLAEKNQALKELVSQIREHKDDLKDQLQVNVDSVLMPLLSKIESKGDTSVKEYAQLLRENLEEIASPFYNRLASLFSNLTPREVEVCHMIRKGMSTKEMADILNISPNTVFNQRRSIRRKLKLADSDTNLTTFLRSLAD